MVIFGTRFFGQVDRVPGLMCVRTKFFHINFLPLIPLEGWFVLGQEGNQWRGRAIPMSGKSVLTAWMRFVTFCMGIGLTLAGFFSWQSEEQGAVPIMVAGVVCIAAFIATYFVGFISRAGLERAMVLAGHLEASPEAVEALRRKYEMEGRD